MRSAMYIAWRKKPEHGSPRGPPKPAWATTARVSPAPPARVLLGNDKDKTKVSSSTIHERANPNTEVLIIATTKAGLSARQANRCHG